MNIIDKLVNGSWNIIIRNFFFILASCKNERSSLQLVKIKQRSIFETFVKIS